MTRAKECGLGPDIDMFALIALFAWQFLRLRRRARALAMALPMPKSAIASLTPAQR